MADRGFQCFNIKINLYPAVERVLYQTMKFNNNRHPPIKLLAMETLNLHEALFPEACLFHVSEIKRVLFYFRRS